MSCAHSGLARCVGTFICSRCSRRLECQTIEIVGSTRKPIPRLATRAREVDRWGGLLEYSNWIEWD